MFVEDYGMTAKTDENHCCELTDEDVTLMRELYELGLTMDEEERRRRQLGYRGIAARWECACGCGKTPPVRTVRDIVHYRSRLGV